MRSEDIQVFKTLLRSLRRENAGVNFTPEFTPEVSSVLNILNFLKGQYA
mgnify:FL=1